MTRTPAKPLPPTFHQTLFVTKSSDSDGEYYYSPHESFNEILGDINNIHTKVFVAVYELKEVREVTAVLTQKVEVISKKG